MAEPVARTMTIDEFFAWQEHLPERY